MVYSIVESMVDRVHHMVPEGNLDTTTALIYDSVNAFSIALHQLTSVQQVYQTTLDCSRHRSIRRAGAQQPWELSAKELVGHKSSNLSNPLLENNVVNSP